MFGQEPRLPVDFLLGRVQEPVAGRVEDWVVEHQARLQAAFEGAHEKLLAAASRRKERHDQHIRPSSLQEGQLVYVKNLGVRGCHKIQDLWSSVVHQVVKAPPGEGVVYTIAPVDALTKVRTVHRDMLKAQVMTAPVAPPPQPTSLQNSTNEVSLGADYDVVMLAPGASPLETSSALPQQSTVGHPFEGEPEPTLDPPSTPEAPPITDSVSSVVSPAPLSPSQAVRRQSTRSTAGQHSNVHHLPRSVGLVDSGSICPSLSMTVVPTIIPGSRTSP